MVNSNIKINQCRLIDLIEEDVLDAMRSMKTYVDITPGEFKEIFSLAYAMALKRIGSLKKAEEIMTSPVHCLRLTTPSSKAASSLAALNISGAPVIDDKGKICGVVSEKDYLKKMGLDGTASFMTVVAQCLDSSGCLVTGLRNVNVQALMSSPAITANAQTTVFEISEMFTEHSINRIPICNSNDQPIGIVTRTDLVAILCNIEG